MYSELSAPSNTGEQMYALLPEEQISGLAYGTLSPQVISPIRVYNKYSPGWNNFLK